MKNTEKSLLLIIYFLLVLLWVYAASSKLLDFAVFREQMQRQVLFPWLKENIVYLLPPLELLTAFALLFEYTQKAGLYVSAIMLSAFTIYIAFGVFKVFGRIPCSCGGIISHMGWTMHLIFNFIFLLLTGIGIYITNRERRTKTSGL